MTRALIQRAMGRREVWSRSRQAWVRPAPSSSGSTRELPEGRRRDVTLVVLFALAVILGGLLFGPSRVNSQGLRGMVMASEREDLEGQVERLRAELRSMAEVLNVRSAAGGVSLMQLLSEVPVRYLSGRGEHEARDLVAEQWFRQNAVGREVSLTLRVKRVDVDETLSEIRLLGERQSYVIGGQRCVLDVVVSLPMSMLEAVGAIELETSVSVAGRIEGFGPRRGGSGDATHLWLRVAQARLGE